MIRRSIPLLGRSAPRPSSSSRGAASSSRGMWSPLGAKSTSSPSSTLSGSELHHMVYRTLPPQNTVEAEEDLGHNVMLHREWISPKAVREGVSWDVHARAPSAVEQRNARASIARGVNSMRNERNRVLAEAHGAASLPTLQVNSQVQDAPGALQSSGYLFDDSRMKFCERFIRRYGDVELDKLVALMEAAAILWGCGSSNEAGREAWYNFFLRLDRNSLEAMSEQRANNQAVMAEAAKQTKPPSPQNSVLIETGKAEAIDEPNAENDDNNDDEDDDGVESLPSEFADLYSSYKAYCEGKSPTFGSTETLLRKAMQESDHIFFRLHKYRKVLETLVAEDVLPQAADERAEFLDIAVELNDQLRTLKLRELRVGESVKEAIQLMERSSGSGVALEQRPAAMSPGNPDLPQQATGI